MRESLFFFDLAGKDWPERLVESLNRSDSQIAADWAAMAPARARFLDEYVFGPENAGRNGAEAVIAAARDMRAGGEVMPGIRAAE